MELFSTAVIVKLLAIAIAIVAGLFGYYVYETTKIIEHLNDDITDLRVKLVKMSEEQLVDAKYNRCAMLLVQGLYNIHPKGGKLRSEDIEYIKNFLDERSDYLLKLNKIEKQSLTLCF